MGYRELSELGGLANWTTVGIERIGRITELSESNSVLEYRNGAAGDLNLRGGERGWRIQ